MDRWGIFLAPLIYSEFSLSKLLFFSYFMFDLPTIMGGIKTEEFTDLLYLYIG